MNIYQLYFDEKSKANCFKESKKIECINFKTKEDIKKNPYFENKYISDIVNFNPIKDNEHLGILSHKFERKTSFTYKDLEETNKDSEVISFFKANEHEDVLKGLNRWHINGIQCLNSILWNLGKVDLIAKNPSTFIMQNHFLAKGDIYKEYVKYWLNPVIEMCENDHKLKELLWVDAGYRQSVSLLGFDYPHHPFVLERLFMYFVTDRKIKVDQYTNKAISNRKINQLKENRLKWGK